VGRCTDARLTIRLFDGFVVESSKHSVPITVQSDRHHGITKSSLPMSTPVLSFSRKNDDRSPIYEFGSSSWATGPADA
jgi:hypothetical protein